MLGKDLETQTCRYTDNQEQSAEHLTTFTLNIHFLTRRTALRYKGNTCIEARGSYRKPHIFLECTKQILVLASKAFLTVILLWHDCSSAIIHSNRARKHKYCSISRKNVLTTARALVEEILFWRTSERGNYSHALNWNHVCVRGRRPCLSGRQTSPGRKGGEMSGGWRHVKVSQDHMTSEELTTHTSSCQESGEFSFW